LASYVDAEDYLRFYEINPSVVELANEYFSFQKDAIARGSDVGVFLGDARIVMERQLRQNEAQRFDVLAIDAFTSDAIPIHLLTKECFDVYWKHLRQDGILAVHVSNVYLDLSPVVRGAAELNGHPAWWTSNQPRQDARNGREPAFVSDWVLVTSNQAFYSQSAVKRAILPWPNGAREPLLWTDDFSSLFAVWR
jgi:hypothetical protein